MPRLKKLTIVQAILEVMKQQNRPMSSQEVYEAIIRDKLYEFKAVNPQHVVTSQIRRHCKGINHRISYSKTKYFEWRPEYKDKFYYLLELEIATDILSTYEDSRNDKKYSILSIEQWFLSEYKPVYKKQKNFENSKYIDIFDTPYSTLDILRDKYLNLVDREIIIQAAESLEKKGECIEWFKIPKDRDIENYYLENLDTDFFKEFKTALDYITSLSRPSSGPYTLNAELEEPLYRMLYANIITAMETYLSDALTKVIISNDKIMRKFVETTKEFKEEKFRLNEIFEKMEGLKKRVEDYLINLSFHNLGKVKSLYKNTLNVNFPEDLERIQRAIKIRHDIVHRNGRDPKDGSYHKIGYQEIQSLSSEVRRFLKSVDKQLQPYKSNLHSTKSDP